MKLKKYLYQITNKLTFAQDSLFTVSVKEQKKFIMGLKEPRDLIERSYNQYLCQRWLKRGYINLFTDLLSIPLIVYFLLKKSDKFSVSEHHRGICIGIADNLVPGKLEREYEDILHVDGTAERLTKADRKVVGKLIRRYPLSFEFILKCLIKVRMYRWIIDKYSPAAIIVSSEYSYTSSFLTYYCRNNNVKHINIMHGEKLYYIRDSFFEFDKFYIWDSYYEKLFIQLRACSSQFETAVPPSLMLRGSYVKKYDYTYYLGGEQKETLVCIRDMLMRLKSKGYRVAVRPHPRYSEMKWIDELFQGKIDVEYPEQTGIEESILRTEHVVSLYSTVINQALNSGVNAVIDDISDARRYKLLHELEYRFVMNKSTLLVSQMI